MSARPTSPRGDVIVIGGGHNGLVAATVLARRGLRVTVCEADGVLGGAARTEYPFPAAPALGQSTGAYLLGLMPPELLAELDLRLPLLPRDPHYALPAPAGSGAPSLLLGADRAENAAALAAAFGAADARADAALQAELAMLRADLAPAWLADPLSVPATAERYVRPSLRTTFVELCTGSVLRYLDRFGFRSERLVAMYAVTDGLSGVTAGPDDPGTGHNFLVHNMGRLGPGGPWMIVRGGMGTVADALTTAARRAGATVQTGRAVAAVTVSGGAVDGVALADGRHLAAPVVLAACDPFRLPTLLGDHLPPEFGALLRRLYRPGSTMKVNLALTEPPVFPGLRGRRAGGATVHLLPGGDRPLDALRLMHADVQAARLPEFPTLEWYLHTTVDPSLTGPAPHGPAPHSSALFVQSVPAAPAASSWPAELAGYTEHLLGLCERFAPGTKATVLDVLALPPPGIEERFGITGGHIHHVDNTVAGADRVPYATGLAGLYAGSAGCHPAGSVIGAAGHNAARRILADLGIPGPAGRRHADGSGGE